MSCNHLNEYLLKEGYANNPMWSCIFIKKLETKFIIITKYVDDLNLVKTLKELIRRTNYLTKELEMKNLSKTEFYIGPQIKHFSHRVLIHQSTYIKKILKCFHMDKTHPLSFPMGIQSLEVKNDLFHLCENDGKLLNLKVPYRILLLPLCILPTI